MLCRCCWPLPQRAEGTWLLPGPVGWCHLPVPWLWPWCGVALCQQRGSEHGYYSDNHINKYPAPVRFSMHCYRPGRNMLPGATGDTEIIPKFLVSFNFKRKNGQENNLLCHISARFWPLLLDASLAPALRAHSDNCASDFSRSTDREQSDTNQPSWWPLGIGAFPPPLSVVSNNLFCMKSV